MKDDVPERDVKVFQVIMELREWRLGRKKPHTEGEDLPVKPMSLNDMLACLKRLRQSIGFWSREGGRQGYLNYVSRFVG